MKALVLTLCGYLPFTVLMLLEALGLLDRWVPDVTGKLALGYLCMLIGLLLMLVGAGFAIAGIYRRRQKQLNIAALVALILWPLFNGLLQYLII